MHAARNYKQPSSSFISIVDYLKELNFIQGQLVAVDIVNSKFFTQGNCSAADKIRSETFPSLFLSVARERERFPYFVTFGRQFNVNTKMRVSGQGDSRIWRDNGLRTSWHRLACYKVSYSTIEQSPSSRQRETMNNSKKITSTAATKNGKKCAQKTLFPTNSGGQISSGQTLSACTQRYVQYTHISGQICSDIIGSWPLSNQMGQIAV